MKFGQIAYVFPCFSLYIILWIWNSKKTSLMKFSALNMWSRSWNMNFRRTLQKDMLERSTTEAWWIFWWVMMSWELKHLVFGFVWHGHGINKQQETLKLPSGLRLSFQFGTLILKGIVLLMLCMRLMRHRLFNYLSPECISRVHWLARHAAYHHYTQAPQNHGIPPLLARTSRQEIDRRNICVMSYTFNIMTRFRPYWVCIEKGMWRTILETWCSFKLLPSLIIHIKHTCKRVLLSDEKLHKGRLFYSILLSTWWAKEPSVRDMQISVDCQEEIQIHDLQNREIKVNDFISKV